MASLEEATVLAAERVESAKAASTSFAGVSASARSARVAALVREAVALLDAASAASGADEHSSVVRGAALCVRGVALDLLPTQSSAAVDALTKAVKLNPSNASAWEALGRANWRRGDLAAAAQALATAASVSGPTQSASLHAARAGVCRAATQSCAPSERAALAEEAVAHAKAGAAAEPASGAAWYALALAHLSSAFSTSSATHDALQPAARAFAVASRCGSEDGNPDFLYNHAVLLKSLHDYAAAVRAFAAAGQLDGSLPWREQVSRVCADVSRIHEAVASKARLKPKRLASAAAAAAAASAAGALPAGWCFSRASCLRDDPNDRVAVCVTLLAAATRPGAVPPVWVAVDAGGEAVAVAMHALSEGALKEGDTPTLLAPRRVRVTLDARSEEGGAGACDFTLLRVDGAAGLLVGGAHPTAHAAPPKLTTRLAA